jgi:hypothetical protein
MIKITSKTDFDKLFKSLDEQGFYIHGDYKIWDNFLIKQINKANILNLKIDAERLIKTLLLNKTDSIEEIQSIITNYFSQFKETDKLKESLKFINPVYKDVPDKEVEEYRQRYLKPNKHGYTWGRFIDLTKSTIKISLFNNMEIGFGGTEYRDYRGHDYERAFKFVVKYLFNENIDDVDLHIVKIENLGIWRTFGKLEIKQFKNGNIEVKHPDIDKLKNVILEYSKDKENLFVQL